MALFYSTHHKLPFCSVYCVTAIFVCFGSFSKNILALSTCGLVMYAGNHDLLCQVGNLNAKNGIESLLNSTTSPATACWSPIKSWQYHKFDKLNILRKPLLWVFLPPPLAVPSKIIREVIQRNANEIPGAGAQKNL